MCMVWTAMHVTLSAMEGIIYSLIIAKHKMSVNTVSCLVPMYIVLLFVYVYVHPINRHSWKALDSVHARRMCGLVRGTSFCCQIYGLFYKHKRKGKKNKERTKLKLFSVVFIAYKLRTINFPW